MAEYHSDFLIIAQITDIYLRVDGKLFNGDKDTEAQLATHLYADLSSSQPNTFRPAVRVDHERVFCTGANGSWIAL